VEQVTTRFIEYLFCPFRMLEERIVVGFPNQEIACVYGCDSSCFSILNIE
jgi:hypothetical protein